MKAAVISLGSTSSKWIVEALKKHFDQVDHLDLRELEVPLGEKNSNVYYKGQPLEKYDCIYARGSYRYASLLGAACTILREYTYLPHTASSFTTAHNKVLTHLKLQAHNVPQPTTYLAATSEAGKKICKNIHFPIVLKLPAGTHGRGVMFADSANSAGSMIDVLALLNQPFIMQEFIETNGSDFRLIVVGDKVVAGMKRTAKRGESRANIHAGGSGEKILADERSKKAAVAAAKACGMEICAVDILPSAKGPLVLEINASPGLQGITNVTKINIADKIAEYLAKKAKESRSKDEKAVIKEQLSTTQEIHGPLDFRGNRILLPEFASMASKITDDEDVSIKAEKGKIHIERL